MTTKELTERLRGDDCTNCPVISECNEWPAGCYLIELACQKMESLEAEKKACFELGRREVYASQDDVVACLMQCTRDAAASLCADVVSAASAFSAYLKSLQGGAGDG